MIYEGETSPEILAIVDSGADASTFHVDVALLKGIDLDSFRRTTSQGVGGSAPTFVCPLALEVEGRRFNANVRFTNALAPTLALLGRLDVFRQFRFGFDERAMELWLEAYDRV